MLLTFFIFFCGHIFGNFLCGNIKEKMELPDSPKLPDKLYCEYCDYISYHKGDFNKHIRTRKHHWKLSGTILEIPGEKLPESEHTTSNIHDCLCGKTYKTSSGLWKHKKLCQNININKNKNIIMEPNQIISNAIIELIKQNNDLKNLILEQNSNRNDFTLEQTKYNTELTTQVISDVSKHITTEIINAVKMGNLGVVNNTMTNSHNNTNNNSFNLNLFLNETCKDAMNIDEFIQKIKISDEDLEETARLGYSGGISRIFIKELNSLDITQKPIHCSDVKRETVYIKDNNKWEKDDDDKSKLILAVKKTAHKNLLQLFEWEKTHPMCKKDPDSLSGRLYNKIILNSMSGGTIEEQLQNINKVVKSIIKTTIIDKQYLIHI